MWEIMWSWWWVKPLPSEKHFIRKDNNIKENNNNLIKNWLRASLKKRSRQSRCKSVNNNNNHKRSKDQVKFLYESKSGKSFRQSGNYGEYINPYFQKNTIGYVTIEYESYYVWYFSFWLVIVERFQVWRGTFHVDIVSVWTSRKWLRVQKLRLRRPSQPLHLPPCVNLQSQFLDSQSFSACPNWDNINMKSEKPSSGLKFFNVH